MIAKEKQHKWFILFVITITTLSSCNKDGFENDGGTMTSFATIYAENGKSYSLVPDSHSSTMYITKISVPENELINQRRVIATYTLLKDVTPKNLMDHSFWNVRLDQIMDVTCKPPVLKSQTKNPDELGTGVLCVKNIHFTARYLNVEYEHAGSNHDINLWFDDTNHPDSDTWITSLCINNLTTTTIANTNDYVSFDVYNLFNETRESRYASGLTDRNPNKLIFRYYESSGKQIELIYIIRYDAHGIYLIQEN